MQQDPPPHRPAGHQARGRITECNIGGFRVEGERCVERALQSSVFCGGTDPSRSNGIPSSSHSLGHAQPVVVGVGGCRQTQVDARFQAADARPSTLGWRRVPLESQPARLFETSLFSSRPRCSLSRGGTSPRDPHPDRADPPMIVHWDGETPRTSADVGRVVICQAAFVCSDLCARQVIG